MLFLGGLSLFLLGLAALAAIADAWDPFDERADARRRSADPRYWGKR